MGEVDPLCVAPPPERPAQVRHHHHHLHHAEDVAVVELVDGDDAREKRYKNSFLPPTVLVPCVVDVETLWAPNENSNAPRHDVANPLNDNGV